MRPYATWFFYGLGLIMLLVSIWLVFHQPGGADDPYYSEAKLPRDHARVNPDNHEGGTAASIDTATGADGPSPTASILPIPKLPPVRLTGAERDGWIRKYCEQLAEYSYQKDMASLESLLAELGSAELKIAEAAYHNLMARHDPRAVPYLELKIAAASSAFEKKHLQELVDFLKTKSILESGFSGKADGR